MDNKLNKTNNYMLFFFFFFFEETNNYMVDNARSQSNLVKEG